MENVLRRVSRDIGGIGQTEFKNWCGLQGLTASESNPDRFGWDFFVEFPAEFDEHAPLDRQSPLRKVLVQIKSSDSYSNTVSMKLSALKNLVDVDLPSFIVYMEYGYKSKPDRARLLHVDRLLVESILKRVRQAEELGNLDLHKIKMSISFNRSKKIEESGSNLRKLLECTFEEGGASYAIEKAAFRKSCGFGPDSISATFSFQSEKAGEEIIDLMLGKLEGIAISSFEVNKRRFGIALDKDIDRMSSGILRIGLDDVPTVSVYVRNDSIQRFVKMDAKFYIPKIPGLPKNLMRLRIANEFLEIEMKFGEENASFNFNIPVEKKYAIGKILQVLDFAWVLSQQDSYIEVTMNDNKIYRTTSLIDAKKLSYYKTLLDVALLIESAFMKYRRDIVFSISINELEEMIDAEGKMLAILMEPGIKVTIVPDSSFSLTPPCEGAFIVPTCIKFGNFAYIAIVRMEIIKTELLLDQRIRVKGGMPHVVQGAIVDGKHVNLAQINEAAEKLTRKEMHPRRVVISTTLGEDRPDRP